MFVWLYLMLICMFQDIDVTDEVFHSIEVTDVNSFVDSLLVLYVSLQVRSVDDDSPDINDNIEGDEVCFIVLCQPIWFKFVIVPRPYWMMMIHQLTS